MVDVRRGQGSCRLSFEAFSLRFSSTLLVCNFPTLLRREHGLTVEMAWLGGSCLGITTGCVPSRLAVWNSRTKRGNARRTTEGPLPGMTYFLARLLVEDAGLIKVQDCLEGKVEEHRKTRRERYVCWIWRLAGIFDEARDNRNFESHLAKKKKKKKAVLEPISEREKRVE